MGRPTSSSYHLKEFVPVAHHVSPRIRNGVPSASSSAWWFGVARKKPRRRGFCRLSGSDHSTASKEPLLPAKPSSGGYEPLCHFQGPGSVATRRTLKVRSPSQKPKTRFLKLGPVRSTQTAVSVYGFAIRRAAVKVNSCFSQTCTGPAAVAGRAVAAAARRIHAGLRIVLMAFSGIKRFSGMVAARRLELRTYGL